LSDETRLNIVTLVAENKELCVCDLTEKLQLEPTKNFETFSLITVIWLTTRSTTKPMGVLQHQSTTYLVP
jgi:hypothetical protein